MQPLIKRYREAGHDNYRNRYRRAGSIKNSKTASLTSSDYHSSPNCHRLYRCPGYSLAKGRTGKARRMETTMQRVFRLGRTAL